jgi:predicted DNA-binding protein
MIKTTTIKIPSETLIELKALAIRKGKSQNDIINELINNGLKNYKNPKSKIKAKKIQMPFINPDKKGNLKDMAGTVEIDDNIDVNEVIDSIHMKKGLY